MPRGNILPIAVMALALVSFLLFIDFSISPKRQAVDNLNATYCTLEAKLCPDGSYVGRSGPQCEFAQCPQEPVPPITGDWQTYTDSTIGVTIQYPPGWHVRACDHTGFYLGPEEIPCGLGQRTMSVISSDTTTVAEAVANYSLLVVDPQVFDWTIDGRSAKRVIGTYQPGATSEDNRTKADQVFLTHNGKLLTITDGTEGETARFLQVLSTVKFSAPGAALSALTKGTPQMLIGSVHLWQEGVMNTVRLRDLKVASSFAWSVPQTLKAISYHDQSDSVASVTTANDADTVRYQVRGQSISYSLDTISRAGGNEVQRAAGYDGVSFLSDGLLMATAGFWEGCADRVYTTVNRQQVYDDWCGSLGISPDQELFVKTASTGIATGNQFDTSSSIGGPYVPIDWTKFTGDVDAVYDRQTKQLIAGFEGHAFLDNTRLITLALADQGDDFLFLVDLGKRTAARLASVGHDVYGRPVIGGRNVIVPLYSSVVVYNLDTKKVREYSVGTPLTVGQYTTTAILGATTNAFILRVRTDYQQDTYRQDKLYAVETNSGKYVELGTSGTLFAGVVSQ